jgi:hypothetical protein
MARKRIKERDAHSAQIKARQVATDADDSELKPRFFFGIPATGMVH